MPSTYKPIDELEEDKYPAISPSEFWDTKKPEDKNKAKQVTDSIQDSFKGKFDSLKKFLNIK